MLTFLRREVKYKISAEQFDVLRKEFAPHLTPDKYYFEKIHNIYYDNIYDEIIRKSMERPVFKEKLRLRTYENDGKIFDEVFVEMKNKFDGTVFKRRIKIPLADGRRLLQGESPAQILGEGQIAQEIMHFIRKTQCAPKIYIRYDRYSYSGENEFRVTFDTNVVSRLVHLDFGSHADDVPQLLQGEYLIEAKSYFAFPLWFTNALTKYKIYPESFSKYGRIYERNLAAEAANPLREVSYV